MNEKKKKRGLVRMIHWNYGPVPECFYSTALNTIPLLLALEGDYSTPLKGRFVGGLLKEFFVDWSPSKKRVYAWAEYPSLPPKK